MRKLTPKEKLFVGYYLESLNGADAVRKAGYKSKRPDAFAYELLRKPETQAAIKVAMDARAEKVEIKAEDVLREIKTAAFLDPLELFADDGTLLPLSQMPESARRAIAGIEVEETFEGQGKDRVWSGYLKKIKLVSKEGTLTLAGRHLGMFVDKKELSGPNGGPIQFQAFDLSRLSDADLMVLADLVAKAGGETPAP